MAKLNMQRAEVSRIMDMVDEYHDALREETMIQETRQWLRDAIEKLVLERDAARREADSFENLYRDMADELRKKNEQYEILVKDFGPFIYVSNGV